MKLLPQTAKLTTEPPEPGVYPNVPAPLYHSWRAVSASLLKVMAAKTPAHARAYMTNEQESSEPLAFGSAYHAYVLEPERFASEYKIVPKMIRRGKEWDALVSTVGDADRILWDEDVAELAAMHMALREQTRTRKLIAVPGACEVCVVWDDDATGLRCKCRVDKLLPSPHDIMLDLKSARSADPAAFCRAAAEYGYDIQAAFYADGVRAATGRECRYMLIPQEKEPPYLSSLIDAHDERAQPTGAACGAVKYREALDRLAGCLESGRFPGYGDEVFALAMPHWAIPAELAAGV